jgi:oxalate decarboxylase/phosphoglucose isomerase-like protein (cupin superfamily)
VVDEFFMIRGHVHELPRDEVYVGLRGQGIVLLFGGQVLEMLSISGDTARRSTSRPSGRTARLTSGRRHFGFGAIYHPDCGADYDWVRRHGMGAAVIADGGRYRVVPSAERGAGVTMVLTLRALASSAWLSARGACRGMSEGPNP